MAQVIRLNLVGGSTSNVYSWAGKTQADTETAFAPNKVISFPESSPGVFTTYNTNNVVSVFVFNQ